MNIYLALFGLTNPNKLYFVFVVIIQVCLINVIYSDDQALVRVYHVITNVAILL